MQSFDQCVNVLFRVIRTQADAQGAVRLALGRAEGEKGRADVPRAGGAGRSCRDANAACIKKMQHDFTFDVG